MENRIFYQEDCNLSLLEGQDDRSDRLRKSGACACAECKRVWL